MHQSEMREFLGAVLGSAAVELDEDRMCSLETEQGVGMSFVFLPPELRVGECQEGEARLDKTTAVLREVQAHYHAMLRKHAKLGELRDELTRAEGREALRREGLELEEVRPPRPDTLTGGPAAIT